MILYLDTSALLKKYFKEFASSDVISVWKKAVAITTSSVAYAETMASIYRKKRDVDIDEPLFNSILNAFHRDWHSFICVEVNNNLNESIDKIVAVYPLRGFDAIHLASAIIINQTVSEDFVFACFDYRLLNAAISEGLNTFPEKLEKES